MARFIAVLLALCVVSVQPGLRAVVLRSSALPPRTTVPLAASALRASSSLSAAGASKAAGIDEIRSLTHAHSVVSAEPCDLTDAIHLASRAQPQQAVTSLPLLCTVAAVHSAAVASLSAPRSLTPLHTASQLHARASLAAHCPLIHVVTSASFVLGSGTRRPRTEIRRRQECCASLISCILCCCGHRGATRHQIDRCLEGQIDSGEVGCRAASIAASSQPVESRVHLRQCTQRQGQTRQHICAELTSR